MRILVTGGAGYVGSFAVRHLLASGNDIVVLDNLCQGKRGAVPSECLVVGDFSDTELVGRLFRHNRIEAVMHFAGATNVGESVRNPRYHYRNNTSNTLQLLETMIDHGVLKLVFSSTAATYGTSEEMPLREDAAKRPVCPYGFSKLAIEWMIEDFARAYGLSYAVLRYFNAAGAAADGSHGEDHRPETHLIPLLIEAVMGRREFVEVYGSDYDTFDGTCIRDYVHVEDLADAHERALNALPGPNDTHENLVLNIGTGRGHSVLQVVGAVESVSGLRVPFRMAGRRQGDPPRLIASCERLRNKLGWKPRYEDVESIVRTAWEWHRTHPNGYGG